MYIKTYEPKMSLKIIKLKSGHMPTPKKTFTGICDNTRSEGVCPKIVYVAEFPCHYVLGIGLEERFRRIARFQVLPH